MRIGVDAMGGDYGPGETVRGALSALEHIDGDDRLVLVGDQEAIRAQLSSATVDWSQQIEIRHASQDIAMDEAPVEALRTKPDSPIPILAQLQRDGKLDAMVSAGSTGACVAASQMRLRRLRGVHRPGIAILTPTPHGPVAICDVGANVNCRPVHLHQYALMAGLYLKTVFGTEDPRVGLLSIGTEEAKGNDLVRQSRDLLKKDSRVNFVGNVEGRDLFSGACDVMVCEGFVGNVVLKLMEGMAEGFVRSILSELAASAQADPEQVIQAGKRFMAKYDYNEYGGAPLLGVAGICMICHGASSFRGIMNAIRGAKAFAAHRLNDQITDALSDQ